MLRGPVLVWPGEHRQRRSVELQPEALERARGVNDKLCAFLVAGLVFESPCCRGGRRGRRHPRRGVIAARRTVLGGRLAARRPAPRRVRDCSGVVVVDPRGLEHRTCGLRVRSGSAGQRAECPLSCEFTSLRNPSFRDVSRSMTGMRRGQHCARRCHFDRT
jgi:hypothetical protein